MNEPFNPEVLAPLSFLPKILAGGILRSLDHSINRRCKVLSAQLSSQPPYKPEIPAQFYPPHKPEIFQCRIKLTL